MRNIILILFLVFNSCQFLDKNPTEKELLNQRLKEINWQKVDQCPSIANCEVLKNKLDQNNCFFEYVSQTIKEKLKHQKLDLNNELSIKVTVSKHGAIAAESSEVAIDSVLKTVFIGFQRVTPAIKQGIYVNSQFDLKINY